MPSTGSQSFFSAPHPLCEQKKSYRKKPVYSHKNSGGNKMHVNWCPSAQRRISKRYDNCFQGQMIFFCYKLLTRQEYTHSAATHKIKTLTGPTFYADHCHAQHAIVPSFYVDHSCAQRTSFIVPLLYVDNWQETQYCCNLITPWPLSKDPYSPFILCWPLQSAIKEEKNVGLQDNKMALDFPCEKQNTNATPVTVIPRPYIFSTFQ